MWQVAPRQLGRWIWAASCAVKMQQPPAGWQLMACHLIESPVPRPPTRTLWETHSCCEEGCCRLAELCCGPGISSWWSSICEKHLPSSRHLVCLGRTPDFPYWRQERSPKAGSHRPSWPQFSLYLLFLKFSTGPILVKNTGSTEKLRGQTQDVHL